MCPCKRETGQAISRELVSATVFLNREPALLCHGLSISMTMVVVSAILLAATPTPAAPVRVTLNEVVGMWVTVSGNCQGQHLFSANGKYKVWCLNSISEGEWSLRRAY